MKTFQGRISYLWHNNGKKSWLLWITIFHYVIVSKGTNAYYWDADSSEGQKSGLLAQREEDEEAEFSGLRWFVQVCGENNAATGGYIFSPLYSS